MRFRLFRSSSSKLPNSFRTTQSSATLGSLLTNDAVATSPPWTFNLPVKLRHVKKEVQRYEPNILPSPEANVHEVRYFLYHLLTVEPLKLAKKWPQWVLETCASWTGNGADLRAKSREELLMLCPLNSGHCELEESEKLAQYPPPACRKKIGDVAATAIFRLKAKEEQSLQSRMEWDRMEQGARQAERHTAIPRPNQGQPIWDEEPMHPGYQDPRSRTPMPSASIHFGMEQSAIGAPISGGLGHLPYMQSMNGLSEHSCRDTKYCLPPLYAGSVSPPHVGLISRQRPPSAHPPSRLLHRMSSVIISPSDLASATTSGRGSNSSGNTTSTTQTSLAESLEPLDLTSSNTSPYSHNRPTPTPTNPPHRSVAEPLFRQSSQPSFYFAEQDTSTENPFQYAQISQSSFVPAAQVSPQSIHMHPLRMNAPAQARLINHIGPYEQRTRFNDTTNTHIYSRRNPEYATRMETRPIGCPSRRQSHLHSIVSNSQLLCSGDMLEETCLSYQSPVPPLEPYQQTPSRASSRTSYRDLPHSYSNSSMCRRPQIPPNSMSYPRPGVSGKRQPPPRSESPYSVISSNPRSVAPSIIEQFPIKNQCNSRIPIVRPTSTIDLHALSQGEYIKFKSKNTTSKREIFQTEVERRAGIECMGPTARVANPATGQQYATLYEQLQEREILDGKTRKSHNTWM